MQKENSQEVPPIITTRVLPFKRKQVFNAWSDPTLLAQWWGPNGFSNTFHLFDFNEGGFWKFTMQGPDGTDYPNEIRFKEIAAPERIVFYHLEPVHRFTVTAAFEEMEGKTKLSFSMVFDLLSEYEKLKDFIAAANEENFDRLERVLDNLK